MDDVDDNEERLIHSWSACALAMSGHLQRWVMRWLEGAEEEANATLSCKTYQFTFHTNCLLFDAFIHYSFWPCESRRKKNIIDEDIFSMKLDIICLRLSSCTKIWLRYMLLTLFFHPFSISFFSVRHYAVYEDKFPFLKWLIFRLTSTLKPLFLFLFGFFVFFFLSTCMKNDPIRRAFRESFAVDLPKIYDNIIIIEVEFAARRSTAGRKVSSLLSWIATFLHKHMQ